MLSPATSSPGNLMRTEHLPRSGRFSHSGTETRSVLSGLRSSLEAPDAPNRSSERVGTFGSVSLDRFLEISVRAIRSGISISGRRCDMLLRDALGETLRDARNSQS